MAARIWQESFAPLFSMSWDDVPHGSIAWRRTMAAARVALGMGTVAPA